MSRDQGEMRHDVARADRVKQFLESEGFIDDLDKLKAAYVDAWAKTNPAQTADRERLWQAVQIVDKVRNNLFAVIQKGEVSRRDLADIATGRKPFF